MERNREGRRSSAAAATAAGAVPAATRRPRVKDASDDEERMDESVDTRSWERSKKERLASLHGSSSSMNARNKRKRQLLPQEFPTPGTRLNSIVEDADESVEETETQVSEDDDEPPPPPLMRRPGPGKARLHTKQEDDIVMDITTVPRKARSSISASSRFTSMARRQLESQHTEIPRQKPAISSQMPLNGSSSPNLLQKQGRKLKPVGPKVRAMKVPKAAEASTLSDQEAEVAEALFDLSRSLPSHSNVLESKLEVKLEAEARTGSSLTGNLLSMGGSIPRIHGLHHPVSMANGYVASHPKDVNASTAEAPKRKRPRVVVKSEDGKIATPVRLGSSAAASSSASPSRSHQSCVGETELDSLPQKVLGDLASLPSDPVKVKAVTDAALFEVKMHGISESKHMEQNEFIAPKPEPQSVTDKEEARIDTSGEGAEVADLSRGNDGNSTSEPANRPVEAVHEDGSSAKLNIDLMASPLKPNALEDDTSRSKVDKQNVGDSSFIVAVGDVGQNHSENQSKVNLVLEDAAKAMDVARGLSLMKEKVDGVDRESNDNGESQVHDSLQTAEAVIQSCREEERDKESSAKAISRLQEEVSDNAMTTPLVSSSMPAATSSSSPVPLSGWMGGLPHLGFYGPGAPPWAAGASSLPNPGVDVKAAHSAMQLPHGAVLPPPVQRMKRCATHVFIAQFIYYDQQLSRRSLWSAALCRAPYNLNIPPVNILDSDKLGGHYLDAARKASAQHSGPSYGYTISQGGGPGMAGTGTPCTAGPMPGAANPVNNAGTSGDTASTSVTGTSSNVMAAHAQYLQAIMQQNGFASFPFPFSGPHGQAAQYFNNPFFPPHLIHPPISQVQAMGQQSSNVLKQPQGVGSLPHSNSQLVAPPLQQQLQLQLAPQSPSQSQQPHNNVGMTAQQQFGGHLDKENTAGVESASTAESRLSSIHQRAMVAQQCPSNLPNLNLSASSAMLGTSLPGLSPHDQDGHSLVSLGVKHSGKGQPQFPGQNPSSLSSSMQPQQFTTGSASGLHMKVLDTTLSQGYSTFARGPGTLGLANSMMGTPSLGVLPGSVDGSKNSGQQQPVYGGHGQHFQRSTAKVPASDDAYAIKARDYTDDKRNSLKPVGGPALISRVDMEVSSPSLQGSPNSASGASNVRMAGGIGRALNPGTPSDVRSSRPASSGQVPLLQNQALPKQAMGRAKTVSASVNAAATPVGSHSVAAYAERVLPGNLGKFPGTGLAYSGQMGPSSQNSKPVHAGVTKVGQRMSSGPAQQQTPNAAMTKNHIQQARGNPPGIPSTPPRLPPSVTGPVLQGGAISMSTPHTLSTSKALSATTSKSPSNGKSSVSVTKVGPPSKKQPVSGPAMSSGLSPAQQNVSSRAPVQQKGPASAVHVPQFHQQQSAISAQQQRLPTTKSQVYSQLQAQQTQYKQPFQGQSPYRPQLFLQQQHQQHYIQQQLPPQQQQAMPQHQQASVSQHYLPNPQTSTQHSQAQSLQPLSQLQQQFQPVTGSTGLPLSSSNLTLGTAAPENIMNSSSSDGVGLKANPTKVGYSSVNSLATGGMPEVISAAHSTVSGQVSSPLSGSSSYLQLAAVKPNEQKPLDVASREDITSARHLASPSSSQAVVASNPSSS